MKVLILGNSDLVKRKIVPAIIKIDSISSYDISTTSNKKLNKNKLAKVYKDYSLSILNSDADTVYVSLPNNLHYKFSKLAIQSGKNVIVDKPAIVRKDQLQKLYDLSKEKNVALSMSSVFNFHKGWKKFKDVSYKKDIKGVLSITFTIPKLDSNNIRMSSKLGGGALHDMGIYCSNAGYLFWETSLKSISINKFIKNELVIGFTVLANYGNGKELIGNFGFERNYKNCISFYGNDFETNYERVFSPPPELITKVAKISGNNKKEYKVGKDDTFKNYLEYFIKNINNKSKLRNEFYTLNKEYLNYL